MPTALEIDYFQEPDPPTLTNITPTNTLVDTHISKYTFLPFP